MAVPSIPAADSPKAAMFWTGAEWIVLRPKDIPHGVSTLDSIGGGDENSTVGVGSATNRQEDCLALLLALFNVLTVLLHVA